MKIIRSSSLLILVILIIGVSSMTAFALFSFPGTEKWKEEVKLSDGRIIVVKREIVFEQGGGEWSSNRSGMKPKEYRIYFEHPDMPGKEIEWRSHKQYRTVPELPLILDVEAGNVVLYTMVGISKTRCEYYSKYVYSNTGEGKEMPLPDAFETKTTNLFLRLGENMPKYVDLGLKQKCNSDTRYRKVVQQVGPKREVCSK